MKTLLTALHAETIKLKSTLALYVCFIAPFAVVVLSSLVIGMTPNLATADPSVNAWQMFARSTFALWALLMLPLFVTLESALLAQLEYGNQQWKHLFSLPLPRRDHLLAKFAVLWLLTLLASCCLLVLTSVAGWLLAQLQVLPLERNIPLAWMALRVAEMMIGALAMLAIHHWVAMRWGNFTIAIAFGITAALVTFLMAQSTRGYWLPWAWAAQPVSPHREHLAFALLASLVGVVFALIAGNHSILRQARS